MLVLSILKHPVEHNEFLHHALYKIIFFDKNLSENFTLPKFPNFLFLFFFYLFYLFFYGCLVRSLSFIVPKTWDLISNCLKNETFLIGFTQTIKIKISKYSFIKRLMKNIPYANSFAVFHTLVVRVTWFTNQVKNLLANETSFVTYEYRKAIMIRYRCDLFQ